MIDDNNNIKICDFGISRYVAKNINATMTLVGKFGFIAPELYSSKCRYNLSADVFFFGHVLYEIMHGKTPFSEDQEGQDESKYQKNKHNTTFKKWFIYSKKRINAGDFGRYRRMLETVDKELLEYRPFQKTDVCTDSNISRRVSAHET